jgi:hypothetical protein
MGEDERPGVSSSCRQGLNSGCRWTPGDGSPLYRRFGLLDSALARDSRGCPIDDTPSISIQTGQTVTKATGYWVLALQRRILRNLAAVTAGFLSACASLTVTDTTALRANTMAPLGSDRISRDGYRLDALAASPGAPDLLILVALSGGGKRSASFAYGALKGMRAITVPLRAGPQPFLREVDAIAGVSGGSFPAAYYGLYRDQTFDRFETDFLYQDTESSIWGTYLLPLDLASGPAGRYERLHGAGLRPHDVPWSDVQ